VLKGQKDLKVDLGCGMFKPEGFIGFDCAEGTPADYFCDLNEGIPLEDNCVAVMYCSHFLEHTKDWLWFLSEMHRVCQKDAQVTIHIPHLHSDDAFSSEHTTWFPIRMFQTEHHQWFKNYFTVQNIETVYDEKGLAVARKYLPNAPNEDLALLFWNVTKELIVTCTPNDTTTEDSSNAGKC